MPASPDAKHGPMEFRLPTKYLANPIEPKTNIGKRFEAPPSDWFLGKWTVTDSTRECWHTAKNVRITFWPKDNKPGEQPKDPKKKIKLSSVTEYDKLDGSGASKPVLSVEEPDYVVPAAWKGRGRGLKAITSTTGPWQILGWGTRPLADRKGSEKWMVVWFPPNLPVNEGIDIYCDRAEGLSRETANEIVYALRQLYAPPMIYQIENFMRPVAIDSN
ncbi:hypothetical protein F5Y16DRAFT_373933 [Xylariaceae sp. FL0255]|nr:hypothetical protein F5Y16DRAFT_373933 [Xylariaceae sp. FL0255]